MKIGQASEKKGKEGPMNGLRRRFRRTGRCAARLLLPALALVLTGLVDLGAASAHPTGGWVGPHWLSTPGAYCTNSVTRSTAIVNLPTIYATPYDSYGRQLVGWRARLVTYDTLNGVVTRAASTWRWAYAFDNSPAQFSGGQPQLSYTWSSWPMNTYVIVDMVFGGSTDGISWTLPRSVEHWVSSYQVTTYTKYGTMNYTSTRCY
jgi:hypothetical protein